MAPNFDLTILDDLCNSVNISACTSFGSARRKSEFALRKLDMFAQNMLVVLDEKLRRFVFFICTLLLPDDVLELIFCTP